MKRLVTAVGLTFLFCGAAFAVIPHEGNFTTRQMAGMAIGFFRADQTRAKCPALAASLDEMSLTLASHYAMDQDDLNETSVYGRKFIARGRQIAAKDSKDATFCDDVQSEMDEDSVELLPH